MEAGACRGWPRQGCGAGPDLAAAAPGRLGRALPAAQIVSSAYRVTGTARRLLGSRLGSVAAVGGVGALAVAELGFVLERDQATFGSFADALLWALSVVIGMQAIRCRQPWGGRLVMLAGFALGLVVVASLAGAIGAFMVEGPAE